MKMMMSRMKTRWRDGGVDMSIQTKVRTCDGSTISEMRTWWRTGCHRRQCAVEAGDEEDDEEEEEVISAGKKMVDEVRRRRRSRSGEDLLKIRIRKNNGDIDEEDEQ